MAYRIHVTAVRNSTAESVRSIYCDILGDGFADVALVENAGWISFRTSVWSVSSRDLIKGLQQLNKPGLQFTTEDACRWYLTICMPDTDPETMAHEFGHHEESEVNEEYYADDDEDDYVDPELAFLEDQPQQPSRPRTAFHRFAEYLAGLGAPLPQSLLDEVHSLSFAEAVARFRQWHQDRLIHFLTSAGVSFNDDAVRKVLAWQGLTEAERDSDIGNLPRLLMAIGLGEEWDEHVAEAENPPPEPEYDDETQDEDTPDPKRFIDDAERLIGSTEASPVDGGPVDVAMKHFHHVRFFPEACQVANDIRALLTVELPDTFDQEAFRRLTAGSSMDRAGCEWVPHGFRIGFENHLLVDWRHLQEQLGSEFSRFFKHLADQATLQLAFAAENEPATRQVYRGKVLDNVWRIDATHPPVPARVLSDALALAADAPKTTHTLRDSAEADAVMEAVKKDSYLHNMDVKRDGNVISCKYDIEFLAKTVFRLRFRDYWIVEPYEKHAEREYQERIRTEWEFRRKAAKHARAQMAPRIGDPIYRGKASIYWKSDLERFKDLDPEARVKFEQGMRSLSFTLLGDLTPKRFRDYVLRCYVSSDALSYACLTASIYGYLCWEFISDFSDGSRLTTTTSGMAVSRPAVRLYYKDYPNLGIEELYEKHRQLFVRFENSKRATPTSLVPTLEGLARLFDDSLVRTDEDEANSEDAEDEYGDEEVDDEEEGFDEEDEY